MVPNGPTACFGLPPPAFWGCFDMVNPNASLNRGLRQGLRLGLLLAFAALGWSAISTLGQATQADLNTAAARATMMRLREHPRPVAIKEWATLRADLARGLALTPDDSLLHDHLGYLYAAYALQSKGAPDLARDFYQQAYTSFSRAASLRPMAPELAQNAGLAARLSQQPRLQAQGQWWDCRAIRFTSSSVALADHLSRLSPDRCR